MSFTSFYRELPATTEWYDTSIDVTNGQQLRFLTSQSSSSGVKPWASWPNNIGPNGDPKQDTSSLGTSRVIMPRKPFCGLVGRIGLTGKPFFIGARNSFYAMTSGRLYLVINDVIGAFSDNSGHFEVTIQRGTLPASSNQRPIIGNAVCLAHNTSSTTLFPIDLYDGEKIETSVDFAMNTPAGELAFARTYRQNKRSDPDYQFMGLGWTHNHISKLTLSGSSPNRIALALIPGGGLLEFTEDSLNAGHFDVAAGSTAVLDYNSLNNEFILTAQDKTKLIYDDSSLLLVRYEWANNETWTYDYDGNNLVEIEDDYGRKLQFTYIDNASAFDDGQLWRVGDHEATGLDGNTPSGRYVEFSYIEQHEDGAPIISPKALLASVRDVRGNTWEYVWYGQGDDEVDPNRLDFLTDVISPSVDTTGDGTDDGSITIKKLEYVTTGAVIDQITQRRGIQNSSPPLIETMYEFQPSGENVTQETTAGKVTIHYFFGGVYAGTADPAGNLPVQALADNYRPEVQRDALGNETKFDWSEDGRHLNQVEDALGNITEFYYNTSGPSIDTLSYSVDATGRITEYTYDDSTNPRLPTRIKVLDPEETAVLYWQEFTYDNKGRTLTEVVMDPSDGTTILEEVTRTYGSSGNGAGLLESITREDLLTPANNQATTYTYDVAGRVVKTHQSSLFGTCIESYSVYDEAGNLVATACINPEDTGTSIPTDVEEARDLYDANDPVKQLNRVTTYEYDALGRRVKTIENDGVDNPDQNITLTVYDALNRIIRTIGRYVEDISISEPYVAAHNAFDHGVLNNQNQVIDTTYNKRGLVRNQTDVDGNVTLYGYDDAGRLVKTIQNASQPTYNNDYDGISPDPALANYTPNNAESQDIITTQAYDAVGNLVKTIDPLGVATYTVYDALNRPIKTVRAAKDTATVDLDLDDVGYDETDDPRVSNYVLSAEPSRDLIQTTTYDMLGRVIRTQQLLENRPTSEWDTTLYGYDVFGRQTRVINHAQQPDYDIAEDPELTSYNPANGTWYTGNGDLDFLTKTEYDEQGRVLQTINQINMTTRFVYDGLGRQIRTIVNFNPQATDPSEWVWSDTNQRWELSNTNTDPVNHTNNFNIISETFYDVDGRVKYTRDILGRMQRSIYDSRGRVIRTISNYVEQDEDDPGKWIWSNTNNRWENSLSDSTPLDHGAENDLNIISDTVYDMQGRVLESYDHRRNVTRHVYDGVGRRLKTITNYIPQGSTDPADWVWDSGDSRWEDGAGNAINFGSDQDQNRISQTTYDLAGRVIRTRDAAGVESRFEYDALGRRVESITNYVNGIFNPALPDEDLASTTIYNKAGQVTRTIDPRGTHTTFSYDQAGRRLTVTTAADSPLEAVNYTCYDKAGRVLRTIQNWQNDPNAPSPDERDESAWLFLPEEHGPYQDRDLITAYGYDAASRRVAVTDPVGNITYSSYYKDGMLQWQLDPEGIASQYRYDALRRRNRVVQVWVDQAASDPGAWTWDSGQSRWEYPGDNPINHGTDNDQNIIVDVTYDKAGRVISQRDPRGNLTTYSYDLLDRRIELTNPLSQTWNTAYANLSDGKTRVTQTYPGITGSSDYPVQREFDRLGRLQSTAYGAPSVTPDVRMSYDGAGNRASMSEYTGSGFTGLSRETLYTYDRLHRLTEVGFDTDGSGSIDEAVSYEYDAGGLRTKLTLPGDLEVVYSYDARGRLTGLTDWDNQQTQFAYDQAGRHIATERANRLRSRYQFDAAGRLRILRHTHRERTLAHFAYQVDKRGNRTEALEVLAHPTTTTDTTIAYNDAGLALSGAWTEVSGFNQTTDLTASLKLMFLGSQALLSMGTGPDHSRYDVYIDQTLWQSFDGYAPSPGQRDIALTLETDSRPLQSDGPHLLEIRNRAEHSPQSSGHKLRFKQLLIEDRTWTLHTIGYTYDQLARLKEARYAPGIHRAAADANLLRHYRYDFDRAGNRTAQSIALNGASPTVTNYTYNAANQLVSDGTNTLTYDNNGNLTSDGVNSYTWDRANRLLSMGGVDYQYDGEGRRVQQTVSSVVKKYLLDIQPGLAVVLSQTEGSDETRFVHTPRGIHARQDNDNLWHWTVQDGLGTVRMETDNSVGVEGSQNLDPFGNLIDMVNGDIGTPYGFTGEQTDANGQVYLRARYYNPNVGVFSALDPFEGMRDRAMSLNGYSWVEGNVPNDAVGELIFHNRYSYANANPVNRVDPSGLCPTNPVTIFDNRCWDLARGLAARFNAPVENFSWMDYGQLELLTAIGTAASISGSARQSLDNAAIIPRLFRENPQTALLALQQFGCQNPRTILGGLSLLTFGLVQLTAQYRNLKLPNEDQQDPRWGRIGLVVFGGVVIAVGSLIVWDELTQPFEYRLTGFDAKVKTLADHLAKLLEYEVAGSPPSDPNPNRNPDGGWCRTIRRIIQEIDGAGYSERQLNRDLEAAGYAGDKWQEIIAAVKAVASAIDKGCKDHWGDFGGGSLAAS